VSPWAIGLLLAFFLVIAVVRKESERRAELASTARLEVTSTGVERDLVDGRHEGVSWDEVQIVEVVLAAHGPHKASGGVLLLGGGAERGCLLPLDALGSSGVVTWLSQLPGFDMARLTQALSTDESAADLIADPLTAGSSGSGWGSSRRRRSVRIVIWER